jgi:hypothetical protein
MHTLLSPLHSGRRDSFMLQCSLKADRREYSSGLADANLDRTRA